MLCVALTKAAAMVLQHRSIRCWQCTGPVCNSMY